MAGAPTADLVFRDRLLRSIARARLLVVRAAALADEGRAQQSAGRLRSSR